MFAPVVFPALAIVAGTAAGVRLPHVSTLALLSLVACLALSVLAWRRGREGAFAVLVLIGFASAGSLMGASRMTAASRSSLREFFEDAVERSGRALPPMVVEGLLRSDAAPAEYGASMVLGVERVQTACGWMPAAGGVRVAIHGSQTAGALDEWRAGRRVRMTTVLRQPSAFQDPGVPDEAFTLVRRGIALVGTTKSAALVEVVGTGHAFAEAAGTIRAYARRAIAEAMPGRPTEAAIVTAILVGDRGGMSPAVNRRLQEAGTYHVIAISGGNVAILAGLVFLVLRWLAVPLRPASVGLALTLCAYGYLTGGSPSVARATIAAAVYLVATAADHRSPALNILGLVALAAVLYEPLGVFDPGLLLSYGATLALLIGASSLSRRGGSGGAQPRRSANVSSRGGSGGSEPRGDAEAHGDSDGSDRGSLRTLQTARDERAPRRGYLRLVLRTRSSAAVRYGFTLVPSALSASRVILLGTACAELGLFPITATLFNRITVAGLALNLAAIPLMTVVQVFGLAVLVTAPISRALATAAGTVAALAANGLLQSSRLVDFAPWLTWRVAAPPLLLVAVYFTGWVLILVNRRRAVRGAAVAATSIAALLIAVPGLADGTLVHRSPAPGLLRVTILDVGQGDAVLVQFPGGRSLLVDAAGVSGSGFDLGDRIITPALLALGVRRLDYLAITHGDPDHVLGAWSVARDFRARELWEGVPVPPHQPLRALREAVSLHGGVLRQVRPDDRLTVGGVGIRVLHPPEPDWERQRVRNDDSVVLELRYGEVSIVLPGDIGASIEQALVPRLSEARIRVLKAAHHGSATSSSDAWLATTRPDAVVFSCGRENRYGHPATSVLGRASARRIPVFRTDRDGAVIVTTDGRDATITTFAGRASQLGRKAVTHTGGPSGPENSRADP